MQKAKILLFVVLFLTGLCLAGIASGAYHHAGDSEKDPRSFLNVYPDKAGTKLDNCATCHSGGSYTSGSKTTTFGSCQWCHYKYGYNKSGDINATLNQYGKDYLQNGRNEAALTAIASIDSDGDGFSNNDEINAVRYPGDSSDDPSKVVAPFRIFTKEQLRAMPQHTQFMLMNTSKSGDYYAEYSGVLMERLIRRAVVSPLATKITAYAPDGYSQGHPIEDSTENSGSSYAPFVEGAYPPATYFYADEADKAKTSYGWCDYSSPGNLGRLNGDPTPVRGGLRLLLALKSDGKELVAGVLGSDNKLTKDSEGPFRVVAPQKAVGPPDQASNASRQDVIWPYTSTMDHNAGFSSKCTTIVKVEPLPAGTTDINVLEAGWTYIDQGKIVVYGALEGPKLIYPFDSAKNVQWEPTLFKWVKSPGIEKKDVVSYRLDYTNDSTLKKWTSVVIEKESKNCVKNHIRFVKESDTIVLEPGTRYWWRVTDVDVNGGSTTSTVRSFTTKAKKHHK